MTRLRRFSAVLVLAAAAVLGACGDDGNGNQTAANDDIETTATSAGTDTTAEGRPPRGPKTVELKNLKFDPDEITVKVGETVVWKWDENVLHNVTSKDGDDLESGNLDEGEYEHTFDEAGTYEYTCTLHAGMDGTVE